MPLRRNISNFIFYTYFELFQTEPIMSKGYNDIYSIYLHLFARRIGTFSFYFGILHLISSLFH